MPVTTGTITISSGELRGFMLYTPPPGAGKSGTIQPTDNKPAIFIYQHGIDHALNYPVANAAQDFNLSTIVAALTNKSMPFLCRPGVDMPLMQVPGTVGSAGQERVGMIAVQCKYDEAWDASYTVATINYIINNLSGSFDVNRIYFFGYSYGGMGGWKGLANTFCRDNIPYWFILSPGPYPAGFPYAAVAASGVQIDVCQHKSDTVATQGWGEDPIAPLNQNSPVSPVQYWKMADLTPTWYSDALTGTNNNYHATWKLINDFTMAHNPTLSTGDVWIRNEIIPFQRALRFNKNHMHR
ncbi:MAG TPA: hypothetical protein VK666_16365 [Chryseolinea sp.]|nr:hypothetical protein [Chryseolinea sp.]